MTWVKDDELSIGAEEPVEEKKFPFWILLGIPLLIPLLKNKKI